MTDDSIPLDFQESEELSIDDVADLFSKTEPDDEGLSEESDEAVKPKEIEETPEDETEDDPVEDEEDPEDHEEDDPEDEDDEAAEDDDDEEEDDEPNFIEDDEAQVSVKVDGKDLRVSVKDLKRLYGQEAALTNRAKSLAAQRTALEEQGLHVAKIMQGRMDKAKANQAKYADVDLFAAARDMEPEDFNALRAAKEAADSEVQALEQEAGQFLNSARATRTTILQQQAVEAVRQITDPESPHHIADWSDSLYNDIRTFAVSQGMDANAVNELTDPAAIKILNIAREALANKGQREATQEKVKTKVKKKLAKSSKKVSGKQEKTIQNKSSKVKSARRDVMDSDGDIDAVTELFMASMSDD